jgi:SAM-dependent methyltransferase
VHRDVWAEGEAYERYMGRWSTPVAEAFVAGLGVEPGRRWIDVGCGTGALTAVVSAAAVPGELVGVDPSRGFLSHARGRVTAARFTVGTATALPVHDRRFDVAVCGLVLNFVPDPVAAVAELARVTAAGGLVAAYVWDYADGMGMLHAFWDAATRIDPSAVRFDQAALYPLCRPGPLHELWTGAGLTDVVVGRIDAPAVFTDLDDYWLPFLGGQGTAPGYVASLDDGHRAALRDLLAERLPTAADGSITLPSRAWTVRGTV